MAGRPSDWLAGLRQLMSDGCGVTPNLAVTLDCCVLALRETPVGQLVEPVLEVSLPLVLVVEVVGMFPEIAHQDWCHVGVCQRIVGVVGGADAEFTLRIGHEPDPARTEVTCTLFDESLFEACQVAERRRDRQ